MSKRATSASTRAKRFQKWLEKHGLGLSLSLVPMFKRKGKLWQCRTDPITEFAWGDGPFWQVAHGRDETIEGAIDALIDRLSGSTLSINSDYMVAVVQCPEFPK